MSLRCSQSISRGKRFSTKIVTVFYSVVDCIQCFVYLVCLLYVCTIVVYNNIIHYNSTYYGVT